MRVFIDSWAWIEYFIGSKYGEKVASIIENNENEIFTCVLNISEITSKIKREGFDFEKCYKLVLSHSKVVNVNLEICKESGFVHAEMKKKIRDFGLIDSFNLVLSKKINAKIVTGDPHFKGMKEVIFVG